MSKRRTTKRTTTKPQSKSSHLATNHSAIISGVDTNVLQRDVVEEYNNNYLGKLVGDKWVRFFDDRSSELRNMYSLLQNSTTLSRAISDKVNLIMGGGFNAIDTGGSIPFLKSLKSAFKYATGAPSEEKILNDLIASVNSHNESLEEITRKAAYDFEAFGNAVVYFKRTTKDGKTTYVLYHAPLETVGVHRVIDNISPSIGLCQDWDNESYSEDKITEIPMFPKWSKDGPGGMSAIHIKNYTPNFFYFGLPSWYPARFWAEIEYFIPKYNIDKFMNGFLPSVFIELFGNVPNEVADKMTKDIVDTFTGVGNGSKIFAQFTSSPEYAAKIQPLVDKNEGKFLDLQKLATQNIVTAAQTTMSLSGVAQGGKLGTNQQIKDELDLIINTTIKQTRSTVLRKIVNPFVELLKEENKGIGNLILDIANSNPISMTSTIDINSTLTTDEKRDLLGYGPSNETPENND